MNGVPNSRRLRILAFDPSLTARLDTADINELTLHLPWEELEPGPVGEYIQVVDVDPASGAFYEPVDLNHPHLLAQDGLAPSESNPQFHQQMVYAVAMTTIRHFERALGRVAYWADHRTVTESGEYIKQFVRRLRIYPHALRGRNAFYSPAKKALLFGYFPVTAKDAYNSPGTIVFTCLSHDIIAHETTHALLDGVHPHFGEPTNRDVYAFHEAFADIVALFQHFTYPSVLQSQISQTRGNLETENLLSQLAQQFGRATGRGGALRDALGGEDKQTGQWQPRRPDPHALDSINEAHERGAILVAAVFRAFLLIYRARTADLFRIATNGTGALPEGEIHPDLTRRLAAEAARSADRVLQMCIRAIDYCPPVDITFGDFLRGIITADVDYEPVDVAGYRTVFIQSFREWGIHPRGVLSLGQDALEWPSGETLLANLLGRKAGEGGAAGPKGGLRLAVQQSGRDWNLESNRYDVWNTLYALRSHMHGWLNAGDSSGSAYADIFGLDIHEQLAPRTVYRTSGGPAFEIHSVRPAIRRTRGGSLRTDFVVEITQRRRGYFKRADQEKMDDESSPSPIPGDVHGDFIYRAGCTVLIDPATQEIRRVIRTPGTIADNRQLERIRRYLTGADGATGNAFDAGLAQSFRADGRERRNEPFALLHESQDEDFG